MKIYKCIICNKVLEEKPIRLVKQIYGAGRYNQYHPIEHFDFCKKHFKDDDRLQAIFVVEVFTELGIFKVDGGRFIFDEKIKNTLTNSKVYSKIYTLKDLYD